MAAPRRFKNGYKHSFVEESSTESTIGDPTYEPSSFFGSAYSSSDSSANTTTLSSLSSSGFESKGDSTAHIKNQKKWQLFRDSLIMCKKCEPHPSGYFLRNRKNIPCCQLCPHEREETIAETSTTSSSDNGAALASGSDIEDVSVQDSGLVSTMNESALEEVLRRLPGWSLSPIKEVSVDEDNPHLVFHEWNSICQPEMGKAQETQEKTTNGQPYEINTTYTMGARHHLSPNRANKINFSNLTELASETSSCGYYTFTEFPTDSDMVSRVPPSDEEWYD